MATKSTKAKEATETFGDDKEKDVEIYNKYLALAEDVEVSDPAQVTRNIALRILEQESVDDILGMADVAALSAEDILERPFVILSRPTWHKAKEGYTDGPGFFTILNLGMQDDNEAITVTCGGSNVLAQLYAMQAKGMIPNDTPMKFIQRATGRGFNVLWLSRANQ